MTCVCKYEVLMDTTAKVCMAEELQKQKCWSSEGQIQNWVLAFLKLDWKLKNFHESGVLTATVVPENHHNL